MAKKGTLSKRADEAVTYIKSHIEEIDSNPGTRMNIPSEAQGAMIVQIVRLVSCEDPAYMIFVYTPDHKTNDKTAQLDLMIQHRLRESGYNMNCM